MRTALVSVFLFAASIAAADDPSDFVNLRHRSPNGDFCVVVRRYPRVGDFERLTTDEYWRGQSPDVVSSPEPMRAAVYRFWPGDYRELLAEIEFDRGEHYEHVLVANEGHFVTHGPIECGRDATLLTIRASDGSLVRRLRVRDVLTRNDQQWLCRGGDNDVRYSIDGGTLRVLMMTRSDVDVAHEVEIDLATGAAPEPKDDHFPAAVRVTALADDGLPRVRAEAGVVPIASQELLDRAIRRVVPEYPEVATKGRVSGRVGVQVVVRTDGTVESVHVVKPLPFGLDNAARDAAAQWTFEPGEERVTGVIAFDFEIVRHFPPRTVF